EGATARTLLPPTGKSEVVGISVDGHGRVWVSDCGNGLFYLENGQLKAFDTLVWRKNALCRVVCNDGEDCWALTQGNSLYKVDRENQTLVRVYNRNRHPGFVPGNFRTAHTIDERGNLWLGSFQSGLFGQNPEKRAFELFNDFGWKLTSDYVMDLMEKRNGDLWVATRRRLLVLDADSSRIRPGPTKEFVQSMLEDHAGRTWMTVPGAILVTDSAGNLLRRYSSEDIYAIPGGFYAYPLFEDSQHRIWGVPRNGLIRIDFEKDEVLQLSHEDTLAENPHLIRTLHAIYEDKNGDFWAGAVKYGLIKIEIPEDGRPPRYTDFMFHTRENKASKSMTANVLFEDSKGHFWVGGYSSGLLLYDRETQIFHPYLLPDSTAIPNIQGIMEAPDGSLWISSNAGLFNFNPETRQFRQFTHEDGLQSNLFIRHAYEKGRSGKMYFGGMDGFNRFDPGDIPPPAVCDTPLIREIRIQGRPYESDVPTTAVRALDLGHRDNSIAIDFVAIDFTQASKIRYSYRLKGFDKTWLPAKSRTATYTNLPAGDYTFEVRATLEGTDWSAAVRRLQISIAPPFWQTSWFFILVAISVLSLAYLVHRLRIRSKVRQFRAIEAIRKKAAADFHDELG
ncbi:MAG: triple tyrosine motif-containing protein, partial [Bacteroidota bacterium]